MKLDLIYFSLFCFVTLTKSYTFAKSLRLSGSLIDAEIVVENELKHRELQATSGSSVIERWSIPEPTAEGVGFRLKLYYKLSQEVTRQDVEYIIYSDFSCSDGTGNVLGSTKYLVSQLVEHPADTVHGYKQFDVILTFNPTKIQDSPILTNVNENTKTGKVELCLGLSLYNGTGSARVAETTSEVLLTITADLAMRFRIDSTDIVLKSTPEIEATERSIGTNAYKAAVYQCDEALNKAESDKPKKQGETIRICFTPDESALQHGIKIDSIDYLQYKKNNITQSAIQTGGDGSSDQLSVVTCETGSTVCSVETSLSPKFFETGGEVTASGQITFINFGSQSFQGLDLGPGTSGGGKPQKSLLNPIAGGHRQLNALNTTFEYTFLVSKHVSEAVMGTEATKATETTSPKEATVTGANDTKSYKQKVQQDWTDVNKEVGIIWDIAKIRLIYVAAGILFASITVCICFCCLYRKICGENKNLEDSAVWD